MKMWSGAAWTVMWPTHYREISEAWDLPMKTICSKFYTILAVCHGDMESLRPLQQLSWTSGYLKQKWRLLSQVSHFLRQTKMEPKAASSAVLCGSIAPSREFCKTQRSFATSHTLSTININQGFPFVIYVLALKEYLVSYFKYINQVKNLL